MEKDRLKRAVFRLESYRFIDVTAHFEIPDGTALVISMIPSGIFHPEDSRYELLFETHVKPKDSLESAIHVSCMANFRIDSCTSRDDIPEYFYSNSLAILFPYIRAFISTVFLQANVPPLVLPIVNMKALGDKLKSKTTIAASSTDGKDNDLSDARRPRQ